MIPPSASDPLIVSGLMVDILGIGLVAMTESSARADTAHGHDPLYADSSLAHWVWKLTGRRISVKIERRLRIFGWLAIVLGFGLQILGTLIG